MGRERMVEEKNFLSDQKVFSIYSINAPFRMWLANA